MSYRYQLPEFAQQGLNGLGKAVSNPQLDQLFAQTDELSIKELAQKIEQETEFTLSDVFSANDVDRLYNSGISTEEKEAWVWYKRNVQLVPMTGWDKYQINDNTGEEFDRLVRAKAIFWEGSNWAPFPLFVSGFLQVKLDALLKPHNRDWLVGKYGKDIYEYHLNLLRDRLPFPLKIRDPQPERRPYVTPISRFAKEQFKTYGVHPRYANMLDMRIIEKKSGRKRSPQLRDIFESEGEDGVFLLELFQYYLQTLRREDFKEADLLGSDVWLYYVEAWPINEERATQRAIVTGFKGNSPDSGELANARADISRSAREEGYRLFQIFLHEVLTDEDAERFDTMFNDKFNSYAPIQYNRVPIRFPYCANFRGGAFAIRPEKREAIAFMEAAGAGILGYDVGVGKTPSAMLELASALYQGKCGRPLIIVPKSTYKTWIEEGFGGQDDKGNRFNGLLNNLGYEYRSWMGLDVKRMDEYDELGILDRPVPDKTITFCTYEALEHLGFGKKASADILEEMVSILQQRTYNPETDSFSNKKKTEDEIRQEEMLEERAAMGDKEANNELEKKEKSDRSDAETRQKIMLKIGMINSGAVAEIDQLGFDYIIVDEAHRAKKVFVDVNAQEEQRVNDAFDKNGMPKTKKVKRFKMNNGGEPSIRGLKVFALSNYIQRTYKKNVMLLTATPFTNSPMEVYSMLSMVAMEEMIRLGIYNQADFFNMFVKPTNEVTVTAANEMKVKEVVKGFVNPKILQSLIFSKINYKPGEVVGVKRPCKFFMPRINTTDKNGRTVPLPAKDMALTYLKMNGWQSMNQEAIKESYKQASKDMGKAIASGNEESMMSAKAMILKAINGSLNNALCPYLTPLEYNAAPNSKLEDFKAGNVSHTDVIESSPKLSYTMGCVASVKNWHEQRGEPVSGQVIYSNRGVYNLFGYIWKYLTEEVGYKKEVRFGRKTLSEVMIVAGGGKVQYHYPYNNFITSSDGKEVIKEAFQQGVVKVILGSDTIKEGINLQKKGSVMYNLFPNWNPTDQRQLEGRIWRQKNPRGFVFSVMPLVADSMDVFVHQKLEEKTARINGIFNREEGNGMINLSDFDPESAKLYLIDDVTELAWLQHQRQRDEDEKTLNSLRKDLENISTVRTKIEDLEAARDNIKRMTPNLRDKLTRLLEYVKGEIEKTKLDVKDGGIRFTPEMLDRYKKIRDRLKAKDGDISRVDDMIAAGYSNYAINKAQSKLSFLLFYEMDLIPGFSGKDEHRKFSRFEEVEGTMMVMQRKYLERYGFTINDDLSEVLKKMEAQIEEKRASFKFWYLQSGNENIDVNNPDPRFLDNNKRILDNRIQSILTKLKEEKEKTQVRGLSPGERVKDFQKYLYLLGWSMKDIDPDNCRIPSSDEIPAGRGKSVIPSTEKTKPILDQPEKDDKEKRRKIFQYNKQKRRARAAAAANAAEAQRKKNLFERVNYRIAQN